MDRIRDIRPPGSPHAAYARPQQIVGRLFKRTTPGPNGCIIWTGWVDRDNYGCIKNEGRQLRAHRAAYQLLVSPVDDNVQIDHTCHNKDLSCLGGRDCLHRRCINPYHLDAVSNRENSMRSAWTIPGRNLRKTHCPQGHPYDEANTRVTGGKRHCRECNKDFCRAYAQRRRSAQAATQ